MSRLTPRRTVVRELLLIALVAIPTPPALAGGAPAGAEKGLAAAASRDRAHVAVPKRLESRPWAARLAASSRVKSACPRDAKPLLPAADAPCLRRPLRSAHAVDAPTLRRASHVAVHSSPRAPPSFLS